MLYTIVAQKPLSNFDLLLYVLQDTDNDRLAKLLERSLKSGEKLDLSVRVILTVTLSCSGVNESLLKLNSIVLPLQRQSSSKQLQHQPVSEDVDNTLSKYANKLVVVQLAHRFI